jgi:hypothetical protein
LPRWAALLTIVRGTGPPILRMSPEIPLTQRKRSPALSISPRLAVVLHDLVDRVRHRDEAAKLEAHRAIQDEAADPSPLAGRDDENSS